MPTINSWNSNVPVEISKGGTNATSMTNTDGVCYYDGTRLVTTAVGTATHVLTSNGAGVAPTFQANANGDVTAAAALTDDFVVTGDGGAKGVQTSTLKVSAAGQMTNASQPSFRAYRSGDLVNATGGGTEVQLIGNLESHDVGGNYDHATGIFTSPVDGVYALFGGVLFENINTGVGHNNVVLQLKINGGILAQEQLSANVNVAGHTTINNSATVYLTAGDTLYIRAFVEGGTQTVTIASDSYCYISGQLLS